MCDGEENGCDDNSDEDKDMCKGIFLRTHLYPMWRSSKFSNICATIPQYTYHLRLNK